MRWDTVFEAGADEDVAGVFQVSERHDDLAFGDYGDTGKGGDGRAAFVGLVIGVAVERHHDGQVEGWQA